MKRLFLACTIILCLDASNMICQACPDSSGDMWRLSLPYLITAAVASVVLPLVAYYREELERIEPPCLKQARQIAKSFFVQRPREIST